MGIFIVGRIPNTLTLARCFFAVCVLGGLIMAASMNGPIEDVLSHGADNEDWVNEAIIRQQLWYQFALLGVLSGALTDFLDGYLARAFNVSSAFGTWLDPIADKLLVGAALIGLCATLQSLFIYIPAALILARDIFITWYRTTPRGKAAISPSNIAKWKTAVEFLAIIGFMLPLALVPLYGDTPDTNGQLITVAVTVGLLALLWIAAAFSLWTAWLYVKPRR